MNANQLKQNATEAAGMLKTLAHPARLMILCALVDNEKTVGELAESSELSQSAFSQHLALLRKEGLVVTRKESQRVYYSLANERAVKLLNTLHEIYCQ